MNLATNNVVKIHDNSVYDYIKIFLDNKSIDSNHTAEEYERDIRLFFKTLRNKDIEHLTTSDLKVSNAEMLKYQTYLSKHHQHKDGIGYSNISVNRKIYTIQSLYEFLRANDFDVNPHALKIKRLVEDRKGIGILTNEEMKEMIRLARYELHDGLEKSIYFKLAQRTSLRVSEILSIKYSDITQDPNNKDMYIIKIKQKGGDFIEKEIHKSIYELLEQIKKPNSDYVFKITKNQINETIKRLCKKMGIPETRKISSHSFKKGSVEFAKEFSNDLHTAQHQAGHKSATTTDKYYLKKPRNILGSVLDFQVDEHVFEKLSHEECLKLLKTMSGGIGHRLKMEAQKIVNNRQTN
jgi:integrase/recombinase XerD